MKMKNKFIGVTLSTTMIAAMVSGCGIQNQATGNLPTEILSTAVPSMGASSTQTIVEIVNSYDNTQELLAKFPVSNPTPIDTKMAEQIQNRLLTGFENWNRGYDAWAEWGNTLYTDDSYYNVHGVRLTLSEYRTAMNMSLQATDMQMGNFNNMIISGDWAAIRYDITSTNRQTQEVNDGTVMEFVKFKDYGGEMGTRVVEGWAGTKGADFDAMTALQNDDEKAIQQEALDKVMNAVIPQTYNLEEKYPVDNPTPIETEQAKIIQSAILNDFDHWNQGYDAWAEWTDTYYDSELQFYSDGGALTLTEYKESIKQDLDAVDVKRISFNNMLISGDWAAIYYKVTSTDKATGEKTVGDVMQFLHFEVNGENVKVIECWTE